MLFLDDLTKQTKTIFDYDQSNYSSRIHYSFLIFIQSCFQFHESGSDNQFHRYIHSKFSKMACESRSIRSAAPLETLNPTLEPNMKWIVWPVAGISPIFPCACTWHSTEFQMLSGKITLLSWLALKFSAIFLLPTEVLVTDSESHTPIFYSSLIVTMVLSGLVFKIWTWDRQTTDSRRQTTLLKVSNLLFQAGHLNNTTIYRAPWRGESHDRETLRIFYVFSTFSIPRESSNATETCHA